MTRRQKSGLSSNFGGYHFGFNGKEKDTKGEWGTQTHYDYGARIYNPAIARWLSIDPIQHQYPESSPYVFSSNTPIGAFDPDGKRTYFVAGSGYKPGKERDFTLNLMNKFRAILGDKFHMVESSPMGGPLIVQAARGGNWSVKHGSTVVELRKHRNVERTVNEVVADYTANGGLDAEGDQTSEPLNLVGSSYGTVVVAQAALRSQLCHQCHPTYDE